MAELVTGPMVSMLKDKASSYLLDKYQVMEGMEEQHKILKRKLPAILDIITDAEEQAVHREGVKTWLEALRMVAYDANQVFDEFKYEALCREAKANGHYSELGFDVVKLFTTHNHLVFRYRMGKKLIRIAHAIEVLVAEMNAFGFKYQEQVPAFKQWRQTDSIVVDPENIVSRSRDVEKHKIVDTLITTGSTANLMVLPIVGMGGLGKTTLAQLIYNDPQVQRHFQLQMWVCTSDAFDVCDLARKICPGENDDEKAIKKLRGELTGKRYLLVLDDVWNRDADKWYKLKVCLHHGATGSVILVTTRIKETAQLMGTVEEHDVKILDDEFIREIIETRAFFLQQGKLDPKLLSMVGKFVDRCVGSPLAAKALGSVLRTKTSLQQWKAVLNKSIICTEESGILPILKLSYDDLPSHMKQCFAFCAVFPKSYEIDVDKLIQLWIANGFIQAPEEVTPECIGKQIFTELVSRSFFQDVKQVLDKKVGSIRGYSKTTCTIHGLMHDVALSTMDKLCVVKTEKPNRIEWLPDTARHLFLSCEKPDIILNASLEKGSPAIQTLLCDSVMEGTLQHLSKYSSMQALRLRHLNGSFLLKAKHLHHLRYLDLSGSHIKELPGDISILYNLQTLNLSGCGILRRLPRQMKYMTTLRHLYTNGCSSLTSMPPDLAKLTSLQTLTCFVAGSGSDCSKVGEIQNLDLGGQLELIQLENVTEVDAKVANLKNKKGLRELTLRWTPCREEDQQQYHLEVMESLTPHDGLQVLCIYSYGGTTFPKCIDMLQNMVELFLVDCNRCETLPWCILPALQVLYLEGLLKLQCFCSHGAPFSLPNLKELTLKELPDIERWWEINERQGQQIMFPQLEKLFIIECIKLKALPGQQTFTNVESVEAPKLSVLDIQYGNQQMSLCAVRYMTSLTNLKLNLISVRETRLSAETSLIELVDSKENWNHKSPLLVMELSDCNLFFHTGAQVLWTSFLQLQELAISDCNLLVHWPEKEFESLVSLMILRVKRCKNLTGYAREASTSERSQLLPCLESLNITNCGELVEVFNVPASIKKLEIWWCNKIEFIFRKQQGKSGLIQGSCSDIRASTTVPGPSSLAVDHFLPCLDITASTSVLELPGAAREISLPPCLEELSLYGCDGLSGVLNLPPFLKQISIKYCNNLQSISCQIDELQTVDLTASASVRELSAAVAVEHFHAPCLECVAINFCDSLTEILSIPPYLKAISIYCCGMLKSLEFRSGGLPLLEYLEIRDCKTLVSLPNEPQAYLSLQHLTIQDCPVMKTLPRCLQERLSSLGEKCLDDHHQARPLIWIC